MKSTEMQPVINIDIDPCAFLKYSGEKLHLAMGSSHDPDVINREGEWAAGWGAGVFTR